MCFRLEVFLPRPHSVFQPSLNPNLNQSLTFFHLAINSLTPFPPSPFQTSLPLPIPFISPPLPTPYPLLHHSHIHLLPPTSWGQSAKARFPSLFFLVGDDLKADDGAVGRQFGPERDRDVFTSQG